DNAKSQSGNQVARSRSSSTEDVVTSKGEPHPKAVRAQRNGTRGVGADVIPFDASGAYFRRKIRSLNLYLSVVARNDVSIPGVGAADDVGIAMAGEPDAGISTGE